MPGRWEARHSTREELPLDPPPDPRERFTYFCPGFLSGEKVSRPLRLYYACNVVANHSAIIRERILPRGIDEDQLVLAELLDVADTVAATDLEDLTESGMYHFPALVGISRLMSVPFRVVEHQVFWLLTVFSGEFSRVFVQQTSEPQSALEWAEVLLMAAQTMEAAGQSRWGEPMENRRAALVQAKARVVLPAEMAPSGGKHLP